MRLTWAISIACVCILAVSNVAFAQSSATGVTAGSDSFSKASLALWHWLTTLDTEADSFVVKENRHQLIEHLRALNDSIYAVESAKHILIYEIGKTSATGPEITRMNKLVENLVTKVDDLKNKLGQVAGLLREQQKAGGQECEGLLTEAVFTRKQWLADLAHNPNLLGDPVAKQATIRNGEAAVMGLRNASIELSNVINRLSNEPQH